ncbi:MAG TPA: uL15 family ribosomal protein [Candidatus Thermoplasmatota archaeon]|nr:uL15 family ribosomal protein [Candidatus Thermoplasmatota archaeon]
MASGGKAKKMRGNHTHGRGKKAGRGAGLRGGRGRAGANKHRYLMLQVLGGKHEHTRAIPWGRVGFKYRSRDGNPKPEHVNVGDLALRFPGQADIDLAAAGIGKLLGSGAIAHKVSIKVDQASPGAIEKVKAAGGQVTVLQVKQEKAKAPAKPDAKGAPAKGGDKAAAPKGDKPSGDKAQAPRSDKPAGDKPKGDKPAGDKPKA